MYCSTFSYWFWKKYVDLVLGYEHYTNLRHASFECDGDSGIRLIPRVISIPYGLAFPDCPLGSCFRLVVICGFEHVARFCLLAHFSNLLVHLFDLLMLRWLFDFMVGCLGASLDRYHSNLWNCPGFSCLIGFQPICFYFFAWSGFNQVVSLDSSYILYLLIFFSFLLKYCFENTLILPLTRILYN